MFVSSFPKVQRVSAAAINWATGKLAAIKDLKDTFITSLRDRLAQVCPPLVIHIQPICPSDPGPAVALLCSRADATTTARPHTRSL